MKTKELTFSAIVLAIGTALHLIFPGMIAGITPDFILPSLFIAMAINPSFKKSIALGLTAGLLSAMVTTAPGGQIPNVVDKLVTSIVAYGIIKYAFNSNVNNFKMTALIALGTVISGLVFLTTTKVLFGLGAPILSIVAVAVIPAAIMNGFIGTIMYNAYKMSFARFA